MFAKSLMAVAAIATSALAYTEADKLKYKEWYSIMGVWDYDWEPHTITTSDGYILTLMNVKKKGTAPKADYPPMLMAHAMGNSPHLWLEVGILDTRAVPTTPMVLNILEAGHDLWFHYSRGTQYSRSTVDGKDPASEEFWDFSWDDMGCGDIRAAMEYII